MKAQATRVLGYASFFFLCFFMFAYWTFPYERLAAYLSDRVAAQGSYTLQIGELSPHWVTGVALDDVVLSKAEARKAEAASSEESPKPKTFRIANATARLGLLSLLVGDRSVSFDAQLEQGEIDGSYTESGDTKVIDADLDAIDLKQVGVLDAVIPLPVQGKLEGEIDLSLAKTPADTEGHVELVFEGLTAGDGEAKLNLGMMGGLTIDPIEMGKVTLELDVKKGVGKVKKLTADGPDVELKGSGEIRLGQPIARSRLSLLIRLKFTEHYKKKSPRTETMFSLLESSGISQIKAAQTKDGALQFRLTGTLSGVKAIPQGMAQL